MNKVYIIVLLMCCFQALSSQEVNKGLLADDYSECVRNAAYKLVDLYSVSDNNRHVVIDIDIIFYFQDDHTYVLSVQWIAETEYDVKKIFWVQGLLVIGDRCCNTSFQLVEFSKNINKYSLIQKLGCVDEFIQKSLGTGKPFKPMRRSPIQTQGGKFKDPD